MVEERKKDKSKRETCTVGPNDVGRGKAYRLKVVCQTNRNFLRFVEIGNSIDWGCGKCW